MPLGPGLAGQGPVRSKSHRKRRCKIPYSTKMQPWPAGGGLGASGHSLRRQPVAAFLPSATAGDQGFLAARREAGDPRVAAAGRPMWMIFGEANDR